jgi:hypothetical protein
MYLQTIGVKQIERIVLFLVSVLVSQLFPVFLYHMNGQLDFYGFDFSYNGNYERQNIRLQSAQTQDK